jgi:hypothetical protein
MVITSRIKWLECGRNTQLLLQNFKGDLGGDWRILK